MGDTEIFTDESVKKIRGSFVRSYLQRGDERSLPRRPNEIVSGLQSLLSPRLLAGPSLVLPP